MSKLQDIKQLKEEKLNKERELKKLEQEVMEAPLTLEEEKEWNEMRKEKNIVFTETSVNGKVETPLSEYSANIEKMIARTKDEKIRLLTQQEELSVNSLMEKKREYLRGNLVNDEDSNLTDSDIDGINNRLIESLTKYFNTSNYETILTKLNKLPLVNIISIIPKEFTDIYLEDNYKNNMIKSKDMLMVAISHSIRMGPEFDDLINYVERQHRQIDIACELKDCEISIYELLLTDKSIEELLILSKEKENQLADKYRKYVESPDKITNIYVQRAEINKRISEEYNKILPNYTDEEDIEKINKEIANTKAMSDIYYQVLELTSIKKCIEDYSISLFRRKTTKAKLDKDIFDMFDKFRKTRFEISIPGFIGTEKSMKQVYLNFIKYFKDLIPAYNKVVSTAIAKGDSDLQVIEYSGEDFAKIITIILSRVLKKVSNTEDVLSIFETTIIFDMVCKLGSELFMLDKLYTEMKPLLEYYSKLK